MGIKRSENINRDSNDEQYETGNEGERNNRPNAIGGDFGEKLDKAMKRKYPKKEYRGKEYR